LYDYKVTIADDDVSCKERYNSNTIDRERDDKGIEKERVEDELTVFASFPSLNLQLLSTFLSFSLYCCYWFGINWIKSH
jgi:hypothetical protein